MSHQHVDNNDIVKAMLTHRESVGPVNDTSGIEAARVRAVVLDIGNVIARWDPQALLASAFDNPEAQQQALADTIAHSDWIDMDRGLLDMDTAYANAVARSSLPAAGLKRIYDNLAPSLTPLTNTMEAMQRAGEQGVPLYILSNMQKPVWAWLQNAYDCWQYCRGIVVSCDTGMVKPEAGIYEYLTSGHALDPDGCVFVDDVAVNVEAARKAGWQGVQLTDRDAGGQVVDALSDMVLANRARPGSVS